MGRVDLFDGTYGHFTEQVLGNIRRETFLEDIGQNSWLTVDEYDRFVDWLGLSRESHVLEVASGSGGPALYLARRAGCRVTGIDVNLCGVATAMQAAAAENLAHRVKFRIADVNAALPFDSESFDGLVCVDSMNHFTDRLVTLREWHRVMKPGARAVFTDPVVVTGPVTNDELALRSSIGVFLFAPPGVNESLIEQAGFRLIEREDVTENASRVSGRWHAARKRHRDALLEIEDVDRYMGLQRFFTTVWRLTRERRLSRIAYFVEKCA